LIQTGLNTLGLLTEHGYAT